MCGIAGILDLNRIPIDPRDLTRFTSALAHRGPDDHGIWYKGHIGLAHTRLSIIDLSSNGHQPMTNENSTIWITYNGEIYNYAAIREMLEEKGHIFRSNTDTEVIIHLYEEKGLACLDYLDGMFAFALWDDNSQELFLARDRVGKKPLIYTIQDGKLVFASELKAVLSLPWINAGISLEGLAHVFSYDHVPWPCTIYENIWKLPPAHYLVFKGPAQAGPSRYWQLDLKSKADLSEADAVDTLLDLMKRSVAKRLRSDVPVGIFLSGGLDSSFIAGLASQVVDTSIETFSIGYQDSVENDPEFDFSRQVSDHFNTTHHEIIFDERMIREVPTIMRAYDEPFCIPNALAHYQLCRESRKRVKVVMAGDGADEIFAGYDVYRKYQWLDLLSGVNPWRDSHEFHDWPDASKRNASLSWNLLKAPRAFRRGLEKQIKFRNSSHSVFTTEALAAIDEVNTGKLLSDFYLGNQPASFLGGLLHADLFINYAWSTTIATDISGMSNSLEIRSPFLDRAVIEFAFSLPDHFKLGRFGKEKYILNQAGKKFLPSAVTKRKKMSYGAGIPYRRLFFNEWLRFVKEIVFDDRIDTLHIFDKQKIQAMFGQSTLGDQDFRLLWKVFCSCSFLIQGRQ